uniref:Uncharacterized protein n=1 Tax=Globodera rostochiensis TaxID=31243 RepID=A0A914GZJ6_GLORO
MHPIMICFVVLTAIVGINGQLLENVEPKKDEKDSIAGTGIGLQLENVDPKKEKEDELDADDKRAVETLRKAIDEYKQEPKVLVEVLDVGNCRKAVKDFCPCGWAKCVRRMAYSCTNELTKCCPINYDLKCCISEHECFDYCIQDYDKQWGAKSSYPDLCSRACRRKKIFPECDHCSEGASSSAFMDCTIECYVVPLVIPSV